ncbi:MFS transporter [Arthrobacter sp. MPF02]|uniref:MFS transporter n=1 Tax=Arthrobacter sp. MPF02 TaxID=3388492 RepID=UPI003984BDBE
MRALQPGKVVAAAFIGTALEWYDFFLFGTTAAIVLAPLFFPSSDPVASTVSAFLSFSAAFVARPIGALIFGHVGDKYGRRGALVATVMLMGAASTLMGLLPTYETAGVIAPIVLDAAASSPRCCNGRGVGRGDPDGHRIRSR